MAETSTIKQLNDLVKQYCGIRKTATWQEGDYTTGCL